MTTSTKRKPYVRGMQANWWQKLGFYKFYMLRESSALGNVWFSIVLIYGIFSMKDGAAGWGKLCGLLAESTGADPEHHLSATGSTSYQNLV